MERWTKPKCVRTTSSPLWVQRQSKETKGHRVTRFQKSTGVFLLMYAVSFSASSFPILTELAKLIYVLFTQENWTFQRKRPVSWFCVSLWTKDCHHPNHQWQCPPTGALPKHFINGNTTHDSGTKQKVFLHQQPIHTSPNRPVPSCEHRAAGMHSVNLWLTQS